jgi:hypothetical protein
LYPAMAFFRYKVTFGSQRHSQPLEIQTQEN